MNALARLMGLWRPAHTQAMTLIELLWFHVLLLIFGVVVATVGPVLGWLTGLAAGVAAACLLPLLSWLYDQSLRMRRKRPSAGKGP